MKKHIVCLVGTRPEAIKMAPIILGLENEAWVNTTVLATAQHREMLDDVLQLFKIKPDIDLNVMKLNQSLTELTSSLLESLEPILKNLKIDALIGQGDTTTLLTAALACFYRKIPFAHLEAGLRTHNMRIPFPEEMNRVLTSQLTTWHFAPTSLARDNLLREGIPQQNIFITGNTVIDSLFMIAKQNIHHGIKLNKQKKLILLTAHRRESFGKSLSDIFRAIRILIEKFEDIEILYPVHPNPNVHEAALRELSNQPRIILCNPLSYDKLVAVMQQSYFILTDSGGLQEEAPALGKPLLVLRNETERGEVVTQGMAKLVGTHTDKIVTAATELLTDNEAYRSMVKGYSPYGDGHAAEKIIKILKEKLDHPKK